MLKLLVLGGTKEAADLVRRLPDTVAPITSWAGRTKTQPDLPGEVRIGGFNGADGLAAYLRENGIGAVIDATHPFAAQISRNAEAACKDAGVPRLLLRRPSWQKQIGDDWVFVKNLEAAAKQLPALGKRPFLTIGRQHLRAFTLVRDVHFIVRLLEDSEIPLPLPAYTTVVGKPPFSVEDEQKLLRETAVDLLITKESGGESSYAKIEAARMERIPVLMIERPAPPPGETVKTVTEALAWLDLV